MKLYFSFLIVTLMLFSCSTLQRDVDGTKGYLVTCDRLESVEDARFCVHFRQGEEVKQTLFYFHGLGDEENVLEKSFFDQSSLREMAQKLHNTIIVTISFGKSYLITAYPDRWLNPEDATVEKMKIKILPELARRFPLAKPWKAAGHSMGGHSLATICTQMPNEFSGCMLLNPMLLDCDPFNFLDLNCLAAPVVRGSYTRKQWQEYGQDKLLERAINMPPTLVQACKNDRFKLYSGARSWATKAQVRGLPVLFQEGKDGCDHFKWDVDIVLNALRILEAPIMSLDSDSLKTK